MIFAINATRDISKLSQISRAVRQVKFETILKYHGWHLWQISRTNHAITYTNHMLGTLDFTGSEQWAPFNFPYSTT